MTIDMDGDMNTENNWNTVWADEGSDTWRVYPATCSVMCALVGTGQKVLDIGCGVGVLASAVKKAGNDVTGLDISPVALSLLEKHHGIKGVLHDMKKLPAPFHDGEFDWCLASQFLEHFPAGMSDRLVSEIARIGKKAVFAVPNDCLSPDECGWHHNVFGKTSLLKLLGRHYRHVDIAACHEFFDKGSVHINLPIIIARCSQTEGLKP